ncbi:MAG TPA: NADP-dependent isocitrate dehydrogenase [Syntrophorhabdaceae bacterium]|nr:NADP-dependent isocitrate dehydrogenase [Syntrophorhabdaceae bacterium]HPP06475.1 NADP-dependent isocitrate dehydrogenase [Syntrophorhabdaceae bacterium]
MDTIEIVYIEGDGAGEDIWRASKGIFDEAVLKAYGGKKSIKWINLIAGQKALDREGKLLPEETLETIKDKRCAIKGPLTTPVGGGFRSVNVYLRQVFDLYVCMRPIRYFLGLPSPLKSPESIDIIVFRENTEDIYKGIEWPEGTKEAKEVIDFVREKSGIYISDDSGIGIKPISKKGTQRFTKWVIDYAIKNKRKTITIVHKGNIMKYTEGAFRLWAIETAKEFPQYLRLEEDRLQEGIVDSRIVVNDRIADNMFMQIILKPQDYDILLCPNLNGDYLSDACAGLIGGLGVAPGANIGDNVAIFEPTHGSAPKYAGKDMINPTSFILSGALMFRYLGHHKVASLIEEAIEKTIQSKIVTYDLARNMEDVTPVRCSKFGEEVAKRIGEK